MNSTELMIKYKHDIVGQFRDLNQAIGALEANDFEGSGKLEIFQAVHELLVRMVSTSQMTMEELETKRK